MSSLIDYAKAELARLDHDEYGIQDNMDKYILDLLELLSSQGHTNHTVHYCLTVFNRLANYKPLTALTGEDDEWNEVRDGLYQNKRYFSVFKEGKDGHAYDSEGIIFSDDGGNSWYTSQNSKIDIEFPYVVPDKPKKVVYMKAEANDERRKEK